MDHHNPDPHIVEAFRKGDPKAFDVLFRMLYPHLCYFAYQLIGDSPDVEDLVKDSFVMLWRKHRDFDNGRAMKAFLYVSARNACIDLLRRRKVKNTFYEEMTYLQGDSGEGLALDQLIRAEFMQEVYNEIEQLPEKRREVLKLAYLEGLKNDEIAERLGISPYTVKVHKVKALAFLRLRFAGRKIMPVMMLMGKLLLEVRR